MGKMLKQDRLHLATAGGGTARGSDQLATKIAGETPQLVTS